MSIKAPVLAADELERLLSAEFPRAFHADEGFRILDAWQGGARVRRGFKTSSLRPGGTISGATMMGLADIAAYAAILASIGWVPLAVTTNLNINFLRKPGPGVLMAEARLLKLGQRLAVCDVAIRSDGVEELVAHATSTYSIPPQPGQR